MENNDFDLINKNNKRKTIIIICLVIIVFVLLACLCFVVIKGNGDFSSVPDTSQNNNQQPNDDVTSDDNEDISDSDEDASNDSEDSSDVANKDEEKVQIEAECNDVTMPSSMVGNAIEDFDFKFLQIENQKSNKVYSPISIKYALKMIEAGAAESSKTQISNLMGSYNVNKYINNDNMSFANGLFVKDTYKENIKDSYVNTLTNNYNAEIIYDSFKSPDVLNNWVSNKTFNLIDNVTDDISNEDFMLVNALAIDMEWVNKIRGKDYSVHYDHRMGAYMYVSQFDGNGYDYLKFDNSTQSVKSLMIGAIVNRYDILNDLGEQNIRFTVKNDYSNWLTNDAIDECGSLDGWPDAETYVNNYIKEIGTGYNEASSSTDFYFYTDDNVKVFAKDLKEYNGKTLQYIGIMPTNVELKTYIENIKASDVTYFINNLKTVELENFKDGVITKIEGYIPIFSFEYNLNLMDDLVKLGVSDVFDKSKANLSNFVTGPANIGDVTHKSNIKFSNEGIKAAAVTTVYGEGAGGCDYDYLYDVPIETIDLTFDNPYLFLIIDKDSKEVWFTGTVYEPLEFNYE